MKRDDHLRHEIQSVLRAFYDPDDLAYAGHRQQWMATPAVAVRAVVARKQFDWDDALIHVVAAALTHRASIKSIALMDDLRGAEEMIWDAIRAIRPAYQSTLVIHAVTFTCGLALILSATYAGLRGWDLLSLLFGGAGFGTVLLVFFLNPLRGIQVSVSNLIQLEIIYSSYTKQINFWRAYQSQASLEVKEPVIQEIERCTERTMWLIQRYCEPGSRGNRDV